MKQLTVLFLISLLVSSCAYIQGKKDEQALAATQNKPLSGKVIHVQGPTTPSPNTTPNPSQNASKMISPITQFVQ